MLIWFYLNVWLSFVVISPNMKFSKRRKKNKSKRFEFFYTAEIYYPYQYTST